jgi:hypothetical protein
MLIVYGFALLSASVLLIMAVAKVKNSPSAPEWATSKILLHTVLFCSMTAFIFGIALLFEVAAELASTQFGAVEALLLGALVVATFLAWRKIRAIGRGAPSAGKDGTRVTSPGGMA